MESPEQMGIWTSHSLKSFIALMFQIVYSALGQCMFNSFWNHMYSVKKFQTLYLSRYISLSKWLILCEASTWIISTLFIFFFNWKAKNCVQYSKTTKQNRITSCFLCYSIVFLLFSDPFNQISVYFKHIGISQTFTWKAFLNTGLTDIYCIRNYARSYRAAFVNYWLRPVKVGDSHHCFKIK